MNYKQGFNGKQGEDRTCQILGKNFRYSVYNFDIDGADFGVELLPEKRTIDDKDRIQVIGRVQAKFFENHNEVKIAKEYVEDEEGVRTEFFALIHTDDGDDEICYFFTAKEIKEQFKPRDNFYIFSLSKVRKYEDFKGLFKSEINSRIEKGIRGTEEFRNQKFTRLIESKFKIVNPEKKLFDNYNHQLFNRIRDNNIVDKLFEALSEFKDFRRIISCRLIDKISFQESRHTSTHYNQFSLNTNHREVLSLFDNINISNKVTIKNSSLFKGVTGANKKVESIIKILNENLIFKLGNQEKNTTISILRINKKHCDCLGCKFENLTFSQTYSSLNKNKEVSDDLWEWMQHAYTYFKFGEYEKAMELYVSIANKAKENKEQVLFFFAKYNQRLAAFKNFENSYPDLGIELDKLNISPEKKEILNSLAENILLNSYAKSIDELYLKIKDFKQRYSINDTANLINRLYAKAAEYINFIDGNWLVLNNFEEAELLFEKVVESCIISYSMKTEHSYHLDAFDDFLVQISIHHCNSSKLLGFFQRNDVRKLPYKTKRDYFSTAFSNFFSKENVDFLYPEINYFDNKTKNPDLRRRVNRIFENLCILLTYLDTEFENITLLYNISYFIEKLDFNVHEISILARPLLAKPNLFTPNELLRLIKVLVSRENLYDGSLLTNCLYTLEEKKYVFPDSERETVNSIIEISIQKPRNGILKVLSRLLDEGKSDEYKRSIQNELKNKFNYELFYQSVISGNNVNPKQFIDSYLSFFSSISEKKEIPSIFYAKSPYTGIGEPLRENLNKMVEVILSINDNSLLRKQIIKDITAQYPYYNFILNLDSFKKEKSFDKFWILENQSEIVLKRIAKNKNIKVLFKEALSRQYNKEISKIYLNYFTD